MHMNYDQNQLGGKLNDRLSEFSLLILILFISIRNKLCRERLHWVRVYSLPITSNLKITCSQCDPDPAPFLLRAFAEDALNVSEMKGKSTHTLVE